MKQSGISVSIRTTKGSILLIILQLFFLFLFLFSNISILLLANQRMNQYLEKIKQWEQMDEVIFRYLQTMDKSIANHQFAYKGVIIHIQYHHDHYFEVFTDQDARVMYQVYFDEFGKMIQVEVKS